LKSWRLRDGLLRFPSGYGRAAILGRSRTAQRFKAALVTSCAGAHPGAALLSQTADGFSVMSILPPIMLTAAPHIRYGVKLRKFKYEQMFSAVRPITDLLEGRDGLGSLMDMIAVNLITSQKKARRERYCTDNTGRRGVKS
jgi:hypothetical protein